MIAIFKIEKDSVKFSDDINLFLIKNRKGYNVERWSNINKSDNEELWCVKIPSDIDDYKNKIDFKELELVEKLPDNWKLQTNI